MTDTAFRPTHPATVRRLDTFHRLTWDAFLRDFFGGDDFQAERNLDLLTRV